MLHTMNYTERNNNSFNFVRMLCSFFVIFAHSYAIQGFGGADFVVKWSGTTHLGQMAVFIFVFLSGIFITKSIRSSTSPFKWIVHRLIRIYPSLLINLIFIIIVGAFFSTLSLGDYFSNEQVYNYFVTNMKSIFNEHELPGVFKDHPYSGMNGVLWFITFILRIYFLCALLKLFGCYNKLIYSNITLCFILLYTLLAPNLLPFLGNNPKLYGNADFPQYVITFIMAALFFLNVKNFNINLWHVIILFVLMFVLSKTEMTTYLFAFGFIVFSLYIGTNSYLINKLKCKDYSYTIFLYGWPVAQVVKEMYPLLNPIWAAIVVSVFAYILSVFLTNYVEGPITKMANSIVDKFDFGNTQSKILFNKNFDENKHSVCVKRIAKHPFACLFFIIISVFVIISSLHMSKIGLYMDAVNPDYVALHILYPENVPAWLYHDNMIEGLFGSRYHFPILNSLYGINLPAYIYLVIGVIFGFGQLSLTLSHVFYGVIILVFCYYLFLKISNYNYKLSLIMLLLLSIFPSFVFAWRTQFYLQLFPLLFFIPALVSILNDNFKNNSRKIFLTFILLGLASASYFIFVIYSVAIIFMTLVNNSLVLSKLRVLKVSVCGFALGYSPFLLGHISIIRYEGIDGWMQQLTNMANAYGLGTNTNNRFVHVFEMLTSLCSGTNEIRVILGANTGLILGALFFLLSLVSCIGIAFFVVKKTNLLKKVDCTKINFLSKILLLCVLLHIIFGVVVGDSLGYQHYVMLTIIFFVIIFTNVVIHKQYPLFRFSAGISLLLLFMLSVHTLINDYKLLREKYGYGYYSVDVNRIAEFVNDNNVEDSVFIFPQWGYWMGTSIITSGKAKIFNSYSKDIVEANRNNIIYYLSCSDGDFHRLNELQSEFEFHSFEIAGMQSQCKFIGLQNNAEDVGDDLSSLARKIGIWDDNWVSSNSSAYMKFRDHCELKVQTYNPLWKQNPYGRIWVYVDGKI